MQTEASSVPGMELVGGNIGDMDEPGIEGGKLMEFVAEIEPSHPIPRLFVAPANLFQEVSVFARVGCAVEFAELMLVSIESGEREGQSVTQRAAKRPIKRRASEATLDAQDEIFIFCIKRVLHATGVWLWWQGW